MATVDLQQTSSLTLESGEQGNVLNIDNDNASARISLFGGHLLSYINKKDNRQRLWLSDEAIFDNQTPIRGGVPICWPWFGEASTSLPDNSPSHGFLRTQTWQVEHAEDVVSQNKVRETKIILVPSQMNNVGFNTNLNVRLLIKVGDSLIIHLETTNLSENPIELSQALHTYLSISDISNIVIDGVTGSYLDKLTGISMPKTPHPYLIDAEVDRIHSHVQENKVMVIDKETNEPLAQVSQRGHDSLVIWNPWIEKSARMKDMSKEGFKTMLCIEAANTDGLQIGPKETHILEQIIY
ncbi:D-hexose-6-phosphate mutarotase [Glaciecola petra]|uniref:Putative glucose-6-phosphate 1-epimerase n=1 Tax=Glaciecola petra TaxID=3075602 RepID=A0ABU2ZN25_9ALTE|nr:D-hexose-6-phosphate mutarotase [Aestuariibacter sp. P117]MDT0594033.1 D-hexose-6-phosphate mutarotase [Aestuariibacter sp. P117]